jgi:hypothetical protein
VIFKFKRGLSQKLTLQNPIEIVVDGKEKFKVEPDKSLDTTLADGAHEVKIFIFSQDKEMGVVNTKVDVHANSKYEVTYEYNTLSGAGKATVTVS